VHKRSGVNKFGRDAYAFGRGTVKTKRVSEQQCEARSDGFPHKIKIVPAVVVDSFIYAAQQRIYFPVYAVERIVKGAVSVHL